MLARVLGAQTPGRKPSLLSRLVMLQAWTILPTVDNDVVRMAVFCLRFEENPTQFLPIQMSHVREEQG